MLLDRNLSLDIKLEDDLVIVNKPAGISTHAVNDSTDGLIEIVQKELYLRGPLDGLGESLDVVHRLDKNTTGLIVFSRNKPTTQKLFELFKNHSVKKRYLFLTASSVDFKEMTVFSNIEKVGNKYINIKQSSKENSNSETFFKKLKLNARYELWEAFPKTGKPHQIRLHATQIGIPILGDTIYGGKPYPHLCLHASDIEIPGYGKWSVSPPIFFERMGLIRDPWLAHLLSSLDRRQRFYGFLTKPDQSLRLIHTENQQLRMDQYGNFLWTYWYDEVNPTEKHLEALEFLAKLINKKMIIRKMLNRGQDPNTQNTWYLNFEDSSGPEQLPGSSKSPEELFQIDSYNPNRTSSNEIEWIAKENSLKYQIKSNQGLSPGIFLDQRENRNWLSNNCKNKSVLNLFSYTCGFSVCAAKGQASEVTSVDISKNFLEWGKKNFILNNLKLDKKYQFFNMDSFAFIDSSIKKNRTFDFIICDPPSFARLKNKEVFRIEKNFDHLLENCLKILSQEGTLLLSVNYEKWSQIDFLSKIDKYLKQNRLSSQFKIFNIPNPRCLDFELPNELSLMKYVYIKKVLL